jgi:hypothetical protein
VVQSTTPQVLTMAETLQPLDISDRAELRQLVEEVQAADAARPLQVDQQTVAILVPVAHRTPRRGRPTSAADPLWNIVGLAKSEGPGDVAENVDIYLAEAYLSREG